MNKLLKKGLAIAASAYFTAYSLLSVYALLDYRKNKEDIRENAPNHLIVREYSANIGRKKKNLALVGEIHGYTNKETRHAAELIEKYENVALEGSINAPKKDLLRKINSIAAKLPSYFYKRGSGRMALSSDIISGIYKKFFKKKMFPLEEKNPLDNLRFSQKASSFFEIIPHLLTAPLDYFLGKSEGKVLLEEHEKQMKERRKAKGDNYFNSKEREEKMAGNIEYLLNKEDINSIICFVGAYHLEPIDSILKSRLKLEEIK